MIQYYFLYIIKNKNKNQKKQVVSECMINNNIKLYLLPPGPAPSLLLFPLAILCFTYKQILVAIIFCTAGNAAHADSRESLNTTGGSVPNVYINKKE